MCENRLAAEMQSHYFLASFYKVIHQIIVQKAGFPSTKLSRKRREEEKAAVWQAEHKWYPARIWASSKELTLF